MLDYSTLTDLLNRSVMASDSARDVVRARTRIATARHGSQEWRNARADLYRICTDPAQAAQLGTGRRLAALITLAEQAGERDIVSRLAPDEAMKVQQLTHHIPGLGSSLVMKTAA
jgi:hypothetical protein